MKSSRILLLCSSFGLDLPLIRLTDFLSELKPTPILIWGCNCQPHQLCSAHEKVFVHTWNPESQTSLSGAWAICPRRNSSAPGSWQHCVSSLRAPHLFLLTCHVQVEYFLNRMKQKLRCVLLKNQEFMLPMNTKDASHLCLKIFSLLVRPICFSF